MTKHEKWAAGLLAVLLVVLACMVTIGGYVRLTESGLSIPQWPVFNSGHELADGTIKTYKTVFPPRDDHGWEILRDVLIKELPQYEGISVASFQRMFWIEWTHRAVAGTISLMYLAVIIVWLLSPVVKARLGWLPLWGALLLFTQVILGGIVVFLHLDAVKLALHLVTAFFFTSMVLWQLLLLVHPPVPVEQRSPGNAVLRTALIVTAIVLVQIFFGGVMAGTKAAFQLNTWPRMGEVYIPPSLWVSEMGVLYNLTENTIFIQFFHRWFAFAAAFAVVYLVLRCMTARVTPLARWLLRSLVSVVTLQLFLGVATIVMNVHTHLALSHQMLALLLLLALMGIIYESARHPVGEVTAGDEAGAGPGAATGEQVNA